MEEVAGFGFWASVLPEESIDSDMSMCEEVRVQHEPGCRSIGCRNSARDIAQLVKVLDPQA